MRCHGRREKPKAIAQPATPSTPQHPTAMAHASATGYWLLPLGSIALYQRNG
jgi:hypothetical protein